MDLRLLTYTLAPFIHLTSISYYIIRLCTKFGKNTMQKKGGAGMLKKILIRSLYSFLCMLMPSGAYAYNWVAEVKVTSIEVTYMPLSLPFYVD